MDKKYGQREDLSNLKPFLPTLAGSTARGISIFISFPLEHHMTLMMSKAKREYSLFSKKSYRGFSSTFIRDILYSGYFWFVSQNLQNFLKSSNLIENQLALPILGGISGAFVSSVLTFPLDLVKVLKVSFDGNYRNMSNLKVFQNVVKQEGLSSLYPSKNKTLISFRFDF